MKGLRIFLATFAITLTIGALAQDSVTPSRPRFLSVGVGTAAGSTNGNINGTGTITIPNATHSGTVTAGTLTATNGTVGGSAICRADGTNCPSTIVHDNTAETITGLWNFSRGNGQPIITSGSWQVLRQQSSSAMYLGGESSQWTNVGIRVGGVNVVDCTSTTCTISGFARVVGGHVGVSGGCLVSAGDYGISSCTYNGAGDVTVTFDSAFGASPAGCTATTDTVNTAAVIFSIAAGSVRVRQFVTSTGVQGDRNFFLTCIGQ